MSANTEHGIVLGFPLDQLFDQRCPLFGHSRLPGIKLPLDGQPCDNFIVSARDNF